MNLRNVSIIHRSIAIFHFTSFHYAPSHGSVCVRPARRLWTATPPITLRAFPTTAGLRKKRSTKRPQQPPSSLPPTSSLSPQNRKCDSLPSSSLSFPPFLFPSLPADSAAERSTRPPACPSASFLGEGEETLTLLSPSESQSGLPIGKREELHARFPPAAPLPPSFPRAAG